MRYRALIAAFLAICLGFLTACSESPTDSTAALTYEQIRGTGLANTCPKIEELRRRSIPLESGESYTITSLCLEPTSFFVKEEAAGRRQEARFIAGKPLTRLTSSLDQVSGDLKVGSDGSLTFVEKDGFDFQAITVKLPGGEMYPFLFTIKDLVATTQPGQTDLETISTLVRATAHRYGQQSRNLLALLRLLEALHHEIRDGLFQDSLPDNRQALYALLRDIETGGGWPYIHRMKLQAFEPQSS